MGSALKRDKLLRHVGDPSTRCIDHVSASVTSRGRSYVSCVLRWRPKACNYEVRGNRRAHSHTDQGSASESGELRAYQLEVHFLRFCSEKDQIARGRHMPPVKPRQEELIERTERPRRHGWLLARKLLKAPLCSVVSGPRRWSLAGLPGSPLRVAHFTSPRVEVREVCHGVV